MSFFEKDIIDKHSKVLIDHIKKSLDYNKSLSKKKTEYKKLKNGANLLWKNYFCHADETLELELLSSVLQRLLNDFPIKSNYMKVK